LSPSYRSWESRFEFNDPHFKVSEEEDLKAFRQWGSKTPGHPENFETPGIEVTTGPLGQGIANVVGLALGDGCQMEGFLNEACSLAGHWGLYKLIAFYDDSHISIEGDTQIAFTEDVTHGLRPSGGTLSGSRTVILAMMRSALQSGRQRLSRTGQH